MRVDAPISRIILTDAFDTVCEEIGARFADLQIHRIDAEDFLIEHAREAIERAVLTGERDRIFLLTALRFTPIAQNKLLKILEEPPAKTHFILMTPSKAGLLPTIRSRLAIENRLICKEEIPSGVEMAKFDLAALYELLQEHRRIDAKSATRLLERLAKEAMHSGRYRTDEALLESFSEGVRLLDMGSPPGFVLTRVGLKLLQRKR